MSQKDDFFSFFQRGNHRIVRSGICADIQTKGGYFSVLSHGCLLFLQQIAVNIAFYGTIVDETGKEILISDGTYSWSEFEHRVLAEKYKHLSVFFETSEDRGKNFLYNLLELIRNRCDKYYEKIGFARYVYTLSRMEPDKNASPEQRNAYRAFSSKMYQWYQGEHAETDCRHLKTAMNLYAYLTREKEETTDAGE